MQAALPSTLDRLFTQYETCHQHPTNVRLHKVAVPIILFCILGFLWPIRLADVHMGMVAAVGYLIYALRLDARLALGLGLELLAMGGGVMLLQQAAGHYFVPVVLVVFVAAWVMQFVGHRIEGKRPAFFQDLLFLLVGPLWTLHLGTRQSSRTAALHKSS